MLYELRHVNQPVGEPPRRWFSGPDMDLIIWHQDGHIIGFQFCYTQNRVPLALTWNRSRDFSHDEVDDGDRTGQGGKMTPICIPDGEPDLDYVYTLFICSSITLDAKIRHFIARALRNYPRRPEPSTWNRAG